MKIRITTIIVICFLSSFSAPIVAQEITGDTLTGHVAGIRQELDVLKRIKISGYMQAQYQVVDSAGARGFAGGDFASGVDKRIILRRARVKFTYDSPINDKGWSTSQYVFQIDVSQNGFTIKDMYLKFTDPWSGWFSLTAGMQNRPFGFEIPYSSSLRESPERGRMSQIIMPNERDLGAMLTIQGPKISNWNWVKLEAGLFNGPGAAGAFGTGTAGALVNTGDFDKFKDFIGHLTLSKSTISETIKWGIGASYYNGGFRQDQVDAYAFGTDVNGVKGFTIDTKKGDVNPAINARGEVKRTYTGFDAQLSIDWFLGLTTVRGEYISGTQPAISGSSTSPSTQPSTVVTTTTIDTTTFKATTSTTTVASDIYSRKFNGAYFYFLQNLGSSPWQAIIKYDWYDPNTDLKGDEIGKSVAAGFKSSNATDLKYTTLGFGIAYRWDANVKITAYVDKVTNETSSNLSGFTNDVKDNVFTLRAQIKF